MLSWEFKCYKNITDQWSTMEGEMQIVECGSHYETNANSNGKKMINGQAPAPSFTGTIRISNPSPTPDDLVGPDMTSNSSSPSPIALTKSGSEIV